MVREREGTNTDNFEEEREREKSEPGEVLEQHLFLFIRGNFMIQLMLSSSNTVT